MKARLNGFRRFVFQSILLLSIGAVFLVSCIPPLTDQPPPPRPPQNGSPQRTPPPKSPVTLVMGSWRTDDTLQMNIILEKFHEAHPNIFIQYDPTTSTEYDAALRAQLAAGTGPDIFYLRSFSVSRNLFKDGYLELLDNSLNLEEEFGSQMLLPWSTESGKHYGVPFIAVSHGIYYNQDLFKKAGAQIPQTWEEMITLAKKFQGMGIIPFANASGDSWTISETIFMNLAPNYIGGRNGRLEYLEGKRCFNDTQITAAFQAVRDLAPYLPANQKELKYADSQQLFIQGKAAMWFGGSWDIPLFEAEKPVFEWSVMPVPPPAGSPGYVTFHLDAGMGLNPASKHKTEALLFLKWMETSEFAELMGNQLPGFFPLHSTPPLIQNPHASAFLNFSTSEQSDIRFAWEKLRDGTPDAYTLITEGAVSVLNGLITPQQAANNLQNGLAVWYQPAKNCLK